MRLAGVMSVASAAGMWMRSRQCSAMCRLRRLVTPVLRLVWVNAMRLVLV